MLGVEAGLEVVVSQRAVRAEARRLGGEGEQQRAEHEDAAGVHGRRRLDERAKHQGGAPRGERNGHHVRDLAERRRRVPSRSSRPRGRRSSLRRARVRGRARARPGQCRSRRGGAARGARTPRGPQRGYRGARGAAPGATTTPCASYSSRGVASQACAYETDSTAMTSTPRHAPLRESGVKRHTYRARDQAWFMRDLPPGESEDLETAPPQLGVAGAIVLEGRSPAVSCVAVELYRQPLAPPQTVNEEGAEAGVDLGCGEAVAPAQLEEEGLELGAGAVGGEVARGQADVLGLAEGAVGTRGAGRSGGGPRGCALAG